MANPRFFNRTYELTINGKGIDITITKLDINFDIKFFTGPRTGEASITVIGLSYDTLGKLEPFTVVSPGTLMAKNKIEVSLRAGYDGNNDLIFKGFLFSVSISQPPELALTISAKAYQEISDLEHKTIATEDNTKLEDVVYSAFSLFGVGFANLSKLDMKNKIGAKLFSGDLIDFIRAIENLACWCLTFQATEKVVIATDVYPEESYETIGKLSGLLGVSNINVYSANICTWLRADNACVSRVVTLDSKLHPSANGRYKIMSLQYKGEYRGRDWYTIYHGIRGDFGKKKEESRGKYYIPNN